MNWRVFWVATISLWVILLVRQGILSWLMPLLVLVITILMLLMIVPCIINCLTHFVSAQVNKLQHVMSVQQGHIKLQMTTENITHPQMDSTIRTLMLDSSKGGGQSPVTVPVQQEVAIKTLTPLFPKNWAFYLLRGECQVVRKKEPRMAVAKRQGREKPAKIEQRKVRGLE